MFLCEFFFERPSFQKTCTKYHISIYFWRKIIFHFPSKEQNHIFGKRKYQLFYRKYAGKIIFQCNLFGKTIISEHLEIVIVPLFWDICKFLVWKYVTFCSIPLPSQPKVCDNEKKQFFYSTYIKTKGLSECF